MSRSIRRYSELVSIPTFQERFEYLKLDGDVGKETFGYDRWLNQRFYSSPEWRKFRRDIIVRDRGCDLGVLGYDIPDKVVIHHMNPITMEDILEHSERAWNPEYVISCSHETHEAIHYNGSILFTKTFAERRPNDTCPWKR